jgi:hypothetical protein
MKIKNWSKFQHFKDRRPPWIKLYRDLLDDMEWNTLDPVASKVLVSLWLIASEDENQDGGLPDIKTLAWRLRMTEKQVLEQVSKLSHWLNQDDIKAISSKYQYDLPETEREKETKKETKAEKEPLKRVIVEKPDSVSQQVWDDWLTIRKSKKAALTQTAWELMLKEVDKAGWTIEAAIDECCLRTWASFKASWVNKPNDLGGGTMNKQEALEARNKAIGDAWLREQGAIV